jgi:hypothetical protein
MQDDERTHMGPVTFRMQVDRRQRASPVSDADERRGAGPPMVRHGEGAATANFGEGATWSAVGEDRTT